MSLSQPHTTSLNVGDEVSCSQPHLQLKTDRTVGLFLWNFLIINEIKNNFN